MKITRPDIPNLNLDRPEVHVFLEGAAPSSVREPAQASEKMSEQKPQRISAPRSTQNTELKTKSQKSPAPKTATKPGSGKKELVMPESIVIDEKAIGKFLVDMPRVLRQKIKQKSLDTGKSMNELIITVLTQAFG